MLYGKINESYKRLFGLKAEILHTNPGSTVCLELEEDNSFKRFFVYFKASRDGFLLDCRRLLGLDGCHLKGRHNEVMLGALHLMGTQDCSL